MWLVAFQAFVKSVQKIINYKPSKVLELPFALELAAPRTASTATKLIHVKPATKASN